MRILLCSLPALLAAACQVERAERDGLVTEVITPARTADLRDGDPKGFLALRLGDEQWLALPKRAAAEIVVDHRGAVLVWIQPLGRDRWLRREVVVPEAVMKPEAVKHLLRQPAD